MTGARAKSESGDAPIVEARSAEVVAPGEDFRLESGARLSPVTVAYETLGKLSASRDNAVLVVHALSGDSHMLACRALPDAL